MAATEELATRASEFLSDLGSENASIELPAGCGKTEAAVALAECAVARSRRTLILTHTNAGVSAIRRRLARYNVRGALLVTTIDSFMQRLARSFPSLGPDVGVEETDDTFWPRLRAAAVEIVAGENVRDILSASYEFVIVDEYQDCSVDQHELVLALADRLPVVVLGDRLQAIFGFGGNVLIPWEDVLPVFPAARPFDVVPHRWSRTNPELGEWLLGDVRWALANGGSIDPTSVGCVLQWPSSDEAKRKVSWKYVDSEGSVVFVVASPWQTEGFAKTTKGNFPILEDIGMRNATRFAIALDAADGGSEVAAAVIQFVLSSTSRVGDALGGGPAALERIKNGNRFAPRTPGVKADLQRAVNKVMEAPSPTTVLDVIALSEKLPDASCFARERVRDAIEVISAVARGERDRYQDAAAVIRAGKRFTQRRDRRATAHPGLIKGLEFDSCVVLDADRFDTATNLYVALTRGATTLHILSSETVLGPHQ